MKKINRNIIIAAASTVVAVGSFYLIRWSVRKRRDRLEEEKLNALLLSQSNNLNQQLESQQSGEIVSNTSQGGTKTTVSPIRNYNGEIINKYSEIAGHILYPAIKSNIPASGHKDAIGYTNLRTSPEVNNKSEWYDTTTNYIGRINTGKKIGTVVGETYDSFDPRMRWFKVKLTAPVLSLSDSASLLSYWTNTPKQYAWVRADNVTFKPYEKAIKSGFDGSTDNDCGCQY